MAGHFAPVVGGWGPLALVGAVAAGLMWRLR
jgi:hypothetical protein